MNHTGDWGVHGSVRPGHKTLEQHFPILSSTIFDFERNFDFRPVQQFIAENTVLPIAICIAYVVFIFGTKWYLSDKEPYKLQGPLKYWNLFLAVFSIIGCTRTLPFLIMMVKQHGFKALICDSPVQGGWVVQETGLWAVLFVLSKIPELVDTVFIVLRKKPLIFLHWYHHVTVLLYCWHSFAVMAGSGFTFITMNYFVHAIMYTYYFGRAARISIVNILPPIAITAMQIIQMVAGIAACVGAYYYRNFAGEADTCHNHDGNLLAGLAMYASYFYLFFMFFWGRYVPGPAPKKDSKKKN